MENEKTALAAQKLEQVVELLKEISDIGDEKTPFILIGTTPRPDKGEDVGQLVTAVYGNGLNLTKAVRMAMDKNPAVKEVLEKSVNVNPMEALLMDFMDKMGGEEDEVCNCPNCTEEREQEEARRSDAKVNPNVN